MPSPDRAPACPTVPADRDASPQTATADACPDCPATVELVSSSHRAAACACGEAYSWRPPVDALVIEPADLATSQAITRALDAVERDVRTAILGAPLATLPPLTPGGRVFHAFNGQWAERRPAPPRVLDADSAELVDVRRLLCELRPDATGPLGWGPQGTPPGDSVGSPLRVRVQCSTPTPTILPGAFAGVAPVSCGRTAAARIEEIRASDPGAAHTLAWLQRHGTLAQGLVALHGRVGLELADAAHRARWVAAPDARREGAPALGRKLVRHAALVWFGPVLDSHTPTMAPS